jgi:hypothetical protein
LSPDLREQLNRTLSEAIRSPDPERRRLASLVLAALQLSAQVTTTAGTRICPRPVSTDLYALFLGDTENPAPDGTVEFVASPERPVTGVWASDTRAFTEWINDLVGTGTYARRYRLPRPEEVNDIGQTLVNASVTSVWADLEPDGQPRLWRSSSSSGPDPHTLTRSELVAATSRDALHPLGLPSLAVLSAASAARGVALARALNIAYAYGRNLNLARDITRARDLDLANDLAHDLAQDLDRVLVRYTALAGNRALGVFPISYENLVSILHAGLRRGSTITAAREAATAACKAAMGSGLANAFLAAATVPPGTGQRRQHDEIAAAFINALIPPLESGYETFAIDLDALAPTLNDACMRVQPPSQMGSPEMSCVPSRRASRCYSGVLLTTRAQRASFWPASDTPAGTERRATAGRSLYGGDDGAWVKVEAPTQGCPAPQGVAPNEPFSLWGEVGDVHYVVGKANCRQVGHDNRGAQSDEPSATRAANVSRRFRLRPEAPNSKKSGSSRRRSLHSTS